MKRAVFSALLALSVFSLSAGVIPAYANDASGSEAVSVEATKEAPAAASVEEPKKAEEVPVALVKEEPVAPAAPVAPVVPDPVAVPAPPVEPAPAPVVPEPVVPEPAAPVAPVVSPAETPAAPEQPAAPEKDVFIDPSPVVVAPSLEAETPPVGDPVPSEDATPVVNVNVMITTEKEINAQGWIFFSATSQNVAPGATLGDYTVNLTGALPRFGVNTANLVAGEDGKASTTLWWECATPGATISVTGPNGLVPIFNEITGTTATEHVLPILGTPGCGTAEPVKETKYVTPESPKFNSAGQGVRGSVELPSTVGVIYTVDPAGATEGPVKVTATAAPETADTIYVIAPGAQTEWSGNLGEFSESVPNPGTPHEYASGGVEFAGKDSPATLVPFAGPFNDQEYAYPSVKGTSHDGSPVTVNGKLQEVIGGVTVKDTLDLSQLCGKATWTWYAKADTESTSPKWIIAAGFLGNLPACDPQGGDDGGDNENPNPNPNPNPWNPGHGHGNGNGNGHGHDGHGGWHNGEWWNNHTGEPGNNGPVGTPGDLSNNVTDSSVNPIVVQAASSESLGLGNTYPDASEWPSGNSSETEDLAYTGFNAQSIAGIILGLLVLGIILVVLSRRHGRSAV